MQLNKGNTPTFEESHTRHFDNLRTLACNAQTSATVDDLNEGVAPRDGESNASDPPYHYSIKRAGTVRGKLQRFGESGLCISKIEVAFKSKTYTLTIYPDVRARVTETRQSNLTRLGATSEPSAVDVKVAELAEPLTLEGLPLGREVEPLAGEKRIGKFSTIPIHNGVPPVPLEAVATWKFTLAQ